MSAVDLGRQKSRAAAISIVSNSALIVLKLAAGLVTGSIAIITEAVHSGIDLVASVIAFFSVRAAEEPADERHPYGHAKFESLAAAIEGLLILVGAGVIIYESARRLNGAPELSLLGLGIAVLALSTVVNFGVSSFLYRQASLTDSPALAGDAAHLRTDAMTSLGALDAITALVVAVAIVVAGLRLIGVSSRALVDEALPPAELEVVRDALSRHGADEVSGYHKLRARRAGSRRYVDVHVQFRDGTTLERAHQLAHELQGQIGEGLRGADVLIHLEPESAGRADDPPPTSVSAAG